MIQRIFFDVLFSILFSQLKNASFTYSYTFLAWLCLFIKITKKKKTKTDQKYLDQNFYLNNVVKNEMRNFNNLLGFE